MVERVLLAPIDIVCGGDKGISSGHLSAVSTIAQAVTVVTSQKGAAVFVRKIFSDFKLSVS